MNLMKKKSTPRLAMGGLLMQSQKDLEEEERKYNNNEDFTLFLRQQA